ncbi:Fic family protein [Lacticaseibacillus sharpeae]|uniref:Fido domain-containing protein n=1 Tax=Lacticaseibacillus sharpeae JCM 1186 = DSM 20505 TaxID=1291052 RepID=A0A0R1ZUR5_9LACO|nr:Fic family protein [Lacticaseibacillus sharpeae]KRM54723.1 hypothetical protein FC18_GL002137 [Lacticaseibacillus sharpeae JCM 1186 = DSM 20505]
MTDNTALAKFITSVGSLNDYGSTALQTKKALDTGSTKPLRQNADDIAIFTDTLKGIDAVKKVGFSTAGIIAINKQFDSPSAEQPKIPGHLRNAFYNEDDRIGIVIDHKSQETYVPKAIITPSDIDTIVDQFNQSPRTESDTWRLFAELAKLQAFQDGNKRTALIAANAAMGTFETGNYLVLPFNDLDRIDFTVGLMRYYIANDEEARTVAFTKMMDALPSPSERQLELSKPMADSPADAKTLRIKPQLRGRSWNQE